MVKIYKGDHVLFVSRGAYNDLYKSMGYVLAGAGEGHKTPLVPGGGTNTPEDENPSSDAENGFEDDTDDEYAYLDEKPLGEMTLKELNIYAERCGYNIEGLEGKREIRAAIKAQQ